MNDMVMHRSCKVQHVCNVQIDFHTTSLII